MISQQALQKILGIEDKVHLSVNEMADKLNVTFHPFISNASETVLVFTEKLKESFLRLNVNILPYESAWEVVPISKRISRIIKYLFNNLSCVIRKLLRLQPISFYIPLNSIIKLSGSKRLKDGISIICSGEQSLEIMSMQYIRSFKSNSIITIVDFPKNIDNESNFITHFDTAMSLFAYHMTNIVLAVDKSKWMVYNFNVSHPIYNLKDEAQFDRHILKTLIPKIVAPISPHKFNEFNVENSRFDVIDSEHWPIASEMKKGAELFGKTDLYPEGKKVDDLPFRQNFHRLIGKMHLDNRSGMSFGFLAYQMPLKNLPEVFPFNTFIADRPGIFFNSDFYIDPVDNEIFILFLLRGQKIVVKIPEIWVMTLRSGSNKVHFDTQKDLLKMGLMKGEMHVQFPRYLNVSHEYKPSFDTKVILAHAVGNAIIAALCNYLNSNHPFSVNLNKKGMGITHWHGYFNKDLLPKGLRVYGEENPHVSCSSPQSAIYALGGKLENFFATIDTLYFSEYTGDIHIEPHHGINVSYPSLVGLAGYIIANPGSTQLGNRFLHTN